MSATFYSLAFKTKANFLVEVRMPSYMMTYFELDQNDDHLWLELN